MGPEIVLDFFPGGGEQGTDEPVRAAGGAVPESPLKPRPPDQVKENGLGIVIGIVGRGDRRTISA